MLIFRLYDFYDLNHNFIFKLFEIPKLIKVLPCAFCAHWNLKQQYFTTIKTIVKSKEDYKLTNN